MTMYLSTGPPTANRSLSGLTVQHSENEMVNITSSALMAVSKNHFRLSLEDSQFFHPMVRELYLPRLTANSGTGNAIREEEPPISGSIILRITHRNKSQNLKVLTSFQPGRAITYSLRLTVI